MAVELRIKFGDTAPTSATATQNTLYLISNGTGFDFYASGDDSSLRKLNAASSSPPAGASSPGTPPQIAYDSMYLYVCVATDTWVRTALASW